MFKVIVERERYAKWSNLGHQRLLHKIKMDPELSPRQVGIRSPFNGHFGRKESAENLSPLKRFLHSRVGRPWNDVYSEICAQISIRTAVQKHVRDHVKWFVETEVRLDRKGLPVSVLSGGHLRDGQLYVCPESGLLLEVPKDSTYLHRYRRVHVDASVRPQDADHDYRKLDGVWYVVTYGSPSPVYTGHQLPGAREKRPYRLEDGWKVRFVTAKRQLSSRELRRLGLL